jgi:trehalose synthase
VIREGEAPAWETPLVLQVSRWDRLKDPLGVLSGFLEALPGPEVDGAHLVLVGPDVQGVTDDPEGADVFHEVEASWRALPAAQRRRVHLVSLPMDDIAENALMVNAIQRHATVVVQKSLREGFGLTVTEAMWKARPVIGSAVGGIQDQIEHGVSGWLLTDPTDPVEFATALQRILGQPELARRLGHNARERAAERYLVVRSLVQYAGLIESLDA